MAPRRPSLFHREQRDHRPRLQLERAVSRRGQQRRVLRLVGYTTGKAQSSSRYTGNSIQCIAFSANDGYFAVGFSGGTVDLSDLATGQQATLTEGYQRGQSVSSIAFSPDGQTLAVANLGGGVQLWDTATGSRSETLIPEGGADGVTSLAFSADGNTVAVAGDSDLVRLWSISADDVTASLAEDGPVESIAYSPDGILSPPEPPTAPSACGTSIAARRRPPSGKARRLRPSCTAPTGIPSPPPTPVGTLACGTPPGAAMPAPSAPETAARSRMSLSVRTGRLLPPGT